MSDRAARLTERFEEAEIDVLLVTDLVNVRYLTGYTGSNGLALVGPAERMFISDFRYLEQAAEEVDDSFARRIAAAPQGLLDLVDEALPTGGLRLGFEADHVSVSQHQQLRRQLRDDVALVSTSRLVETLRAVKEPDELAHIKAATALADSAFERLLREPIVGRTERELALTLEHDMRQRGAERVSFETIVAAGAHGALPHAQLRDVAIREGDLVVIDWGAQLDGYCSDCTRTVAAGDPGTEARNVYELVLEAQLAGLDAVRAGRGGRDVDQVAREVIASSGYGEQFGHGLGHGVGLAVHERPTLSTRSEDELQVSNVVTVEPGVYVPHRFGVRIEDLVVVTDDGCEILTCSPKQLLVVD
ncbi:MAG TPA: Xaa-Pro peptidase family protein [Solirubrobacteraceae bacterium]